MHTNTVSAPKVVPAGRDAGTKRFRDLKCPQRTHTVVITHVEREQQCLSGKISSFTTAIHA